MCIEDIKFGDFSECDCELKNINSTTLRSKVKESLKPSDELDKILKCADYNLKKVLDSGRYISVKLTKEQRQYAEYQAYLIVEERNVTKSYANDNISENDRSAIGQYAELAVSLLLGIPYDGSFPGGTTENNVPDLIEAGYRVGVKACLRDKVILCHKSCNYDQVICIINNTTDEIKNKDTVIEVLVIGILRTEDIPLYCKEENVLYTNLQEGKCGFLDFDKTIEFSKDNIFKNIFNVSINNLVETSFSISEVKSKEKISEILDNYTYIERTYCGWVKEDIKEWEKRKKDWVSDEECKRGSRRAYTLRIINKKYNINIFISPIHIVNFKFNSWADLGVKEEHYIGNIDLDALFKILSKTVVVGYDIIGTLRYLQNLYTGENKYSVDVLDLYYLEYYQNYVLADLNRGYWLEDHTSWKSRVNKLLPIESQMTVEDCTDYHFLRHFEYLYNELYKENKFILTKKIYY